MQPLNYLNTTGGMIWTAACALFGIFAAWLYYRVINSVPASWLCDYNETPSPELLSGKRVNYARSGIIMSAVTAACLVLCRLQFNKGYDIYFVLFAFIIIDALMIAICDIRYTIIPDQFTIALAVLGAAVSIYDIIRGYGILHQTWWSPLAGAALGAAVMILIDFIGMLIYKKDGMGFGDVKLFAAVGLITGFPGTIFAFIISMITATVCFCIIMIVVRILVRRAAKASEGGEGSGADAVGDEQTQADASVKSAETAEEPTDAAVKAEAEEEQADDASGSQETAEEGDTNGSYLAFGPYIALALICYLVFNDFVYNMVELYLRLF